MSDNEDPDDWKARLRVPPWCPVCGVPMRGGKSTKAYYDYGCCWLCEIEFVEGREERWQGGWRPTKEEIEACHAKLYGKYGKQDD